MKTTKNLSPMLPNIARLADAQSAVEQIGERAAQAQERLRTQKFQEVILARAAGDDSDEIEDAIAALEYFTSTKLSVKG